MARIILQKDGLKSNDEIVLKGNGCWVRIKDLTFKDLMLQKDLTGELIIGFDRINYSDGELPKKEKK